VKLFIYNENCTMAGHSVPERELERYENPEEGGDWTAFDGRTEDDMIELARSELRAAATSGAGSDRYHRRVARTILEALLWSDEKIDREFNRNGPRFTREQIACVAEWILAAAFDRIEACIPDTIPLAEYNKHRESIDHAISMAMDTAGMALAILFAQTSGEGMGVWDWAGSEEFRDSAARFVQERLDPAWPGLKPGDKCHPATRPFADLFADEWQETIE
jgi:hypothetical protein